MDADSPNQAFESSLDEYLSHIDNDPGLLHLARTHRVLPVYSDLGGSLFLTAGLEIWTLSEEERTLLTPESDPHWCLIGLVSAAKKYPRLGFLTPQRPSEASTCVACNGTGRMLNFWCGECFGVGWRHAF